MRRPADSTLWNFLKSRSEVSLPRVMAVAALSGLANALLIAVINSAAHATTTNQPDVRQFLLFIVAMVTYIVTQRYILRVSQIEIEKIIEKIRLGLSDKIRRSDLHSIETLGRSQLYASVNTDTLALSRAVQPLMIACQSVLLVMFSLGYIYVLEPAAFFLTLLICGIGIAIHFRNRKQLVFELEQATAKENELFDVLTHLLDGFKEVKLSSARNRDLYAHLQEIAAQAAHFKTRTGIRYADYYLFTQVMFQLLLAAMVFILPQVSSTLVQSDQITSLTASILFIMGPLTVVVGALPQLRTATHAIDNVSRLDQALDIAQELSRDRDNGDLVKAPDFRTIEIRQGVFSHKDKDGRAMFTLGPLNCTITRNETLLVVGGNGSGKSTFFKVLTGLYYLDTGSILVDGIDITSLGYRRYRELFSAIFSDYHLFARLYGLTNIDDATVEELLRRMQLEHKTSWRDGRFENQDLSTGQKKRLALIVSLLEDKPVCVFDEWAADQDPQFRQFFYDTLLPELKAKGKTVIAASHDDRFFSVGDRVLKMEMGQFVPFSEVESA